MYDEPWLQFYKALKNIQGALNLCFFYLACIGMSVAVCVPYPGATTWQFITRIAAMVVLFFVPVFSAAFCLCFYMTGRRILAGIEYLINSGAVLAVTWIAPLDIALGTLPLPWLYRLVVLLLAVAVPCILWLLMLLAFWRGRSGPSGDIFFS